MNKIYSSLAKLNENGQSAVLCLVTQSIGSTPRKAGSRMLLLSDGSTEGTIGGGKIEYQVIEEARKMLNSSQTKNIEYNLGSDLGMQCGGKMNIYFESINSSPRLFIFGAGHIGKVLSAMAVNYPFNVSLIDNREGVFQNIGDGVKMVNKPFPEVYENIDFRENDFVVITTYKHTYDEEIAAHFLKQPQAYIGMMASKRKAALARKKWEELGISTEKIAKVFSPIGVDIQCERPEEIALSIMAQLVDEFNKLKKNRR